MPPPPGPGAPPPGGYQPYTGGGTAGPGGRTLGEPTTRLIARFIDALIIGIPMGILLMIFNSLFTQTENIFGVEVKVGGMSYLGYFLMAVVQAGVYFAYEYLLTKTQGATIGKKVMKLQIVGADGAPLSDSANLLRAGIWGGIGLINWIIPVMGWILYMVFFIASAVMLFTDAKHEDIPDKIAKTNVVTA
jgi:uncharacterized RDD family membrane protein YckC